jgi:hypothetical protein
VNVDDVNDQDYECVIDCDDGFVNDDASENVNVSGRGDVNSTLI